MRPYGLPRNDDVANPDCADIHLYALKSSRARDNGKSSHRNSASKRATRRIWKRCARRENKAMCFVD